MGPPSGAGVLGFSPSHYCHLLPASLRPLASVHTSLPTPPHLTPHQENGVPIGIAHNTSCFL